MADLEEMGVQYLDVYSAENALARVADPHLVGYADLSGADVCKCYSRLQTTESEIKLCSGRSVANCAQISSLSRVSKSILAKTCTKLLMKLVTHAVEKENKRRQTYQLSELEPAGAKVVAKAYPGQPGSIFVRKNGQPQLLDSSQLTFRETLHIVPGDDRGIWI